MPTYDWYDEEHDVREGYDIAQVCLNGHMINSSAASMPQFNQKYCTKCGSETITQCPSCSTAIRGYYHSPGIISVGPETPNAYCHNCGKSYPWTESRLQAAREFADMLGGLTEEETVVLKNSLDDLVKETPQTTVAATRFKKIVAKTGRESAEGFKQILVDIISQAARKIIWGA